ncbi:MAG: M48 family metalloprotease [Alphaproteobacteria bacterium]
MIRLVLLALAGLVIAAVLRRLSGGGAGRLARNRRPLEEPELNRVTGRLARAVGIERPAVYAVGSPIVNAFAAPDGGIYLTDGLLAEFKRGRFNAVEMGSIIAHELGHVALGHAPKRMRAVWLTHIARAVAFVLLGRINPGLAIQGGNLLSQLVLSKLSRTDEFQADAFASGLMQKAGYGTAPQIAMLRKIAALHPAGGAAQVSWLASHPPIDERVAALEREVADEDRQAPG